MATMAEKTMISVQKEVDKLNLQLEKKSNKLNKLVEKSKKLNCDWTRDEYLRRLHILQNRAQALGSMWIQYDDEVLNEKQNGVHWDISTTTRDIEDIERRLENAKKRLAKATETALVVIASVEEQETIEQKANMYEDYVCKNTKESYEEWLARFKSECLLDGIVIEEASSNWFSGYTKSGKRFCMYGNDINNWTKRSFHCYTLRIDGYVIFTSGLFSTAYRLLKK